MQELFLKILARGGLSKPDRTEGISRGYRPIDFRTNKADRKVKREMMTWKKQLSNSIYR